MKNPVVDAFSLCLVAGLATFPALGFLQATPPEQPDFNELRKLFQEARTHATEKEFEESNAVFERILEKLPKRRFEANRKLIYYSIAGNHARQGQKKEALSFLRQAVDSGFWNHKFLAKDPALKSLQEEAAFEEIVKEAQQGLLNLVFSHEDLLTGKKLDRKDFEGKVLLVDLWATWCGPCRRALPHLVELQKRFGKDDLRVIGLSCEKPPLGEKKKEYVRKVAKQYGINYSVVFLDREEQAAAEVRSLPTLIYFDRNHVERGRDAGYLPPQYLQTKVVPLLNEKAAKAPTN